MQQMEILDQLPFYLFWKDKNFLFQGANKLFLEVTGYCSLHTLCGKSDYEMPWGKTHADKYLKDDHDILQGKSKLNYIETQLQATGKTLQVRVSKKPMYNSRGNIIGIICAYDLIKEVNSINLSPQQQKCLQLTGKGYSAKQIANILKLSQRTVEYYLQLIKNKLNCKTKIQLIEKTQCYQFATHE